jgi:hypothetical protein
MMADCPHCGMAADKWRNRWDCGTTGSDRSKKCLQTERDHMRSDLRIARAEIAALKAELAVLLAAVEAVTTLIGESEGVAGLHLNGDLAPWDELLEGGQFEEWLAPLSAAQRREGE